MNEQVRSTTHDAFASTDSIGNQLFRGFRDSEYRHAYANELLTTVVALQIRTIREQRGWTQEELGRRCGGKAQGWISKLEDPNYGKLTLSTLKTVAKAFDCILDVRFKSFLVHSDEQDRRVPGDLRVNSYDEDAVEIQAAGEFAHARNEAIRKYKLAVATGTQGRRQRGFSPRPQSPGKQIHFEFLRGNERTGANQFPRLAVDNTAKGPLTTMDARTGTIHAA